VPSPLLKSIIPKFSLFLSVVRKKPCAARKIEENGKKKHTLLSFLKERSKENSNSGWKGTAYPKAGGGFAKVTPPAARQGLPFSNNVGNGLTVPPPFYFAFQEGAKKVL